MAPWRAAALAYAVAALLIATSTGIPICLIKSNPTSEDFIKYNACLYEQEETREEQGTDKRNIVEANYHMALGDLPICNNVDEQTCARLLHTLLDRDLEEARSTRIRRSAATRTENPLASFPTTPAYVEMLQMYYNWRQKKGYGKTVGRWGRSVDKLGKLNEENSGDNNDSPAAETPERGHTVRNHVNDEMKAEASAATVDNRYRRYNTLLHMLGGLREKRSSENLATEVKMSPKMMKLLYEYGAWRNKNGYGKLGGRYG